jgi:hypothetical protein
MTMDDLRCKTPEMEEKEIRAYLLAYLLRTVIAVAAAEHGIEPARSASKGQAGGDGVRPEDRGGPAGAVCGASGCHAEGSGVPACGQPARPVGAGARKRRPKPSKQLEHHRHIAKLAHNRVKP